MARYIIRFSSPYEPQGIFNAFGEYMKNEGFEYREYKGEQVWKKGKGLATAPQFLKLGTANDGTYVLEAWIKFALLPGVYVGEMGIKGFFAAVPKQLLKGRVDATLRAMKATVLPN